LQLKYHWKRAKKKKPIKAVNKYPNKTDFNLAEVKKKRRKKRDESPQFHRTRGEKKQPHRAVGNIGQRPKKIKGFIHARGGAARGSAQINKKPGKIRKTPETQRQNRVHLGPINRENKGTALGLGRKKNKL